MFQKPAINRWLSVGAAIVLALLPAPVRAEDRPPKSSGTDSPTTAESSVEMFKAIQDGQIEVQLIAKDSTLCHVRVKNKTDRPLNVVLPEAFAGVPVLAQRGGGNNTRRGNTPQGFGGGMGGMMGGRGGAGRGFFNVKPEVVGKIDVPIVCLDHGKPEPRAKIKYEIKPITGFTNKPGVYELCQMLGTGQIAQRSAQAAAWNLNNGMTWQQLAAKRLRYANGTTRPYFQPEELKAAIRVALIAVRQAKEKHGDDKSDITKGTESEYRP